MVRNEKGGVEPQLDANPLSTFIVYLCLLSRGLIVEVDYGPGNVTCDMFQI